MASAFVAPVLSCSAGPGRAPSDDSDLVKRLIRQLRSTESSAAEGGTQRSAAYDLGQLGRRAKEALPSLLDVVDPKNDDWLRIDAVQALGAIAPDDRRVIARLAALLSEELGRADAHSNRTVGFLLEATVDTLGKGGASAIPALIEKLAVCEGHLDDEIEIGVSHAAADALGRIGLPALPALLDALKDPWRRQGAAQALGNIGAQGGSASVPVLLRYIDDADDGVRGSIYDALGKIGPAASGAVPALVAALDRPGGPQLEAVYALGRIGPEARPALPRLERLRDETGPGDKAKIQWAIDQVRGRWELKTKPR